jgi:cell fate (sporulation/competence/biofilm development) regulator YlbF (YheA/YmcA/DUF963 family)
MEVIKKARELGAAIQATEEYKNFIAAKERNDADEELQKQIAEFNLLKMQYDAEMQKEDPDKEKIQQINTDITALYGTIIGGKSMTEYNEAYTAYNELCTKISNIILMCQNGEDPETCEPSSCTGNCGTCGGCH